MTTSEEYMASMFESIDEVSSFLEDEKSFLVEAEKRVVKRYGDVRIVHWDSYVHATLGLPSNKFGGCGASTVGEGIIIINTATLDSVHFDAIIAHELGHLEYRHGAISLENEMQADKFAYDSGHDILSALIELRSIIDEFVEMGLADPSVKTMFETRIQKLASYGN